MSSSGDIPTLLVIRDDPGGRLRPRLQLVSDLRARQSRVEFRGRYCNSSCTLLLGVEDVCVSPRTRFGFHGPHYLDRPIPEERFEYWSQRMADAYPPRLRGWFMSTARYKGAVPITLTGAQLIEMGFPRCPKGTGTTTTR